MSLLLPRRGPSIGALRALLPLALFLAPGCKLWNSAANAPGQVASGILGDGKKPSERVSPSVLQGAVMRFSDTVASRILQATEEFAARAGTPEAKLQGLRWRIGQTTAAYSIACNPNANIALLDMLVLVSLGRAVHEDHWQQVWGEADRPMLEAFTTLERDAWTLASPLLEDVQIEQIRASLKAWRERNPDLAVTAFTRLPVFQDIALEGQKVDDPAGGLGALLSVDPLAGLEPAVREIEQARMFGERTMFYLQRAPLLLSAQVELLGLEFAQRPEVRSSLEDTRRFSQAAASLAETAERLPESVRVEREAAIEQASSELAEQRAGLVADLEKVQGPASRILTDAEAALAAGERMSSALQGTIGSLDAFIGGFRDEPSSASAVEPAPQEPRGKPFDVVEYGEAAARIGDAARELGGLVATLDRSLPEVRRVLDEAGARGAQAVDHAYSRTLRLGLALIAAAALATLLVRWISVRFLAPRATA